jgi:hypothetical protein
MRFSHSQLTIVPRRALCIQHCKYSHVNRQILERDGSTKVRDSPYGTRGIPLGSGCPAQFLLPRYE